MARLVQLVDESEDNWLVHECMMEEKNVLHNEIDAMLKRKKRLLKMVAVTKNANNKINSSHLREID